MKKVTLSAHQKALSLNLDPNIYGTFSEIGAGQEVVRHFLDVVVLQAQLQKLCLPTTWMLVMPYMAKKMTNDMYVSLD